MNAGNSQQAEATKPSVRRKKWLWLILLLVPAFFFSAITYLHGDLGWIRMVMGGRVKISESGPVSEEYFHRGAPEFSPDGRMLAYIWSDMTSAVSPEWDYRAITMTHAVRVHWFPIARVHEEESLPLDSIDLRPSGVYAFSLYAEVHFSPDSAHLAAICARYIAVVNLRTGRRWKLHFDGEYFGSMAWLSDEEIAYTTQEGNNLMFWRHRINEPQESRLKVHQELLGYSLAKKKTPPPLRRDYWSPNGQFVVFESLNASGEKVKLLCLKSATILPLDCSSIGDVSWRPDSGAVLVNASVEGPEYMKKRVLMETDTRAVTDLTAEFEQAFGRLGPLEPLWTADGKYVVGRDWTISDRGAFLLQPKPWNLIRLDYIVLKRVPWPGWLLGKRGNQIFWVDYSGHEWGPLDGWGIRWTWSPDGKHAADVRTTSSRSFWSGDEKTSGKVIILKPNVPESSQSGGLADTD